MPKFGSGRGRKPTNKSSTPYSARQPKTVKEFLKSKGTETWRSSTTVELLRDINLHGIPYDPLHHYALTTPTTGSTPWQFHRQPTPAYATTWLCIAQDHEFRLMASYCDTRRPAAGTQPGRGSSPPTTTTLSLYRFYSTSCHCRRPVNLSVSRKCVHPNSDGSSLHTLHGCTRPLPSRHPGTAHAGFSIQMLSSPSTNPLHRPRFYSQIYPPATPPSPLPPPLPHNASSKG